MAQWRDEKIAELARQLTYSPADKRRLQLSAAVDLATHLDPSSTYPWEFILFRITGFRPKEPIEHAITGVSLRADLSQFIEFLSDTLSLQAAEAASPVLTLEEVVQRFGVSSKTIQRWRRQGLLAQRFIFAEGRKRLGFLAQDVARFADSNAEKVRKSATFSQLSDTEKARIIRYARWLAVRCHCSMTGLSRRIATHLERSAETIRYTIRKFDRDHPEVAVFPEVTDTIREADRQNIVAHFDRGVSVTEMAGWYGRTRSSIYRVVNRHKAEQLKAQAIEYVPHELFGLPDAEMIMLQAMPAAALEKARQTVFTGVKGDPLVDREPRGLPTNLAAIFSQPMMPQELETDAFRRMNYFKFKAKKLQDRLVPAQATATDLGEIEELLAQARRLLNDLVQANLRVAVHVARKHQRVNGREGLSELVSDAIVWLMRGAEKFDFARGVKFATYASYAIMKNFARYRDDGLAWRDSRLVTGQEATLAGLRNREEVGLAESLAERLDSGVSGDRLRELIAELPERERLLVTARFGLNHSEEALSLSELGRRLNLTKTRVRQLETRALRKLRGRMEEKRSQAARAG